VSPLSSEVQHSVTHLFPGPAPRNSFSALEVLPKRLLLEFILCALDFSVTGESESSERCLALSSSRIVRFPSSVFVPQAPSELSSLQLCSRWNQPKKHFSVAIFLSAAVVFQDQAMLPAHGLSPLLGALRFPVPAPRQRTRVRTFSASFTLFLGFQIWRRFLWVIVWIESWCRS
jgi:hypothetical protein